MIRLRNRRRIMREIKFRAWSKQHKEMLDVREIGFKQNGGIEFVILIKPRQINERGDIGFEFPKKYIDGNSLKLMQHTGLKDKNGKEIYEGDIFEYEYVLGEGYKYKTTDNPEMFNGVDVVGFANSEFIGENRYLMLSRYVNIKVIGNKFDNPELLEEDNNE
jgi:uncharacterized phage protein (TIGR01671 family)